MNLNNYFDFNFFNYFIKNLQNLSYLYITLDFKKFNTLKEFLVSKKKLSQLKFNIFNTKKENNLLNLRKNSLVYQSRVIKKKEYTKFFSLLNISEFVVNKQKEIYLRSNNRKLFLLKANLIFQKKFIFDLLYFNKLNKSIYNYFFKIKNLGNFFFLQYRIFGLGFKIKRSSLLNSRGLRFEIGFGHGIYYALPTMVKCLRRKRRFFIFSSDLMQLNYIKKHINDFKHLNPYKIRGLKDVKLHVKMKKGKKQAKK